jgi:Cdc6-like AAA superfamily ATPase
MQDKEIILKRINILESIYKRLNSLQDGYRQNIALLGPAGVGKSTILKYIISNFHRPELTFAYVDLQCSDFNLFVHKLLGSLLYGYLQEKGLIIKEDFCYLSKAAEQFLPNTASSIKLVTQLIEKHKYNEAYQKSLDSIDIFTQESGMKLVIIIDEFHLLEDLNIKNVFSILGKKIMLQKSVAFIVSSSKIQEAQKILSEKLSLLFGNFETINISTLDHKTSKEFISNIISPCTIADIYVDFIINLTAGFPFYIKIIAKEAARVAENYAGRAIDSRAVKDALFNLLTKETGLLNEKFNNIIEPRLRNESTKLDSISMVEILIAIANNYNKLTFIAKQLQTTNQKIKPRLAKLVEQELIIKNSSFYRINDPLFELWLKFVFSKRLNRLSDDEIVFKNNFDYEIDKLLEGFAFEAKRKIIERIEEVFKRFQDESIVFERRRLKLARFDELRPLSFTGNGIKEGLFGRNPSNIWITALKPGNVNEDDIMEFAAECDKFKDQGRIKKILISLGEMDLNAALLAKEEKIQTWRLDQLNLLLSLYGKPSIIHY